MCWQTSQKKGCTETYDVRTLYKRVSALWGVGTTCRCTERNMYPPWKEKGFTERSTRSRKSRRACAFQSSARHKKPPPRYKLVQRIARRVQYVDVCKLHWWKLGCAIFNEELFRCPELPQALSPKPTTPFHPSPYHLLTPIFTCWAVFTQISSIHSIHSITILTWNTASQTSCFPLNCNQI